MDKELVFSVTEKDCEFTYTRGTGPGGQKKNKTSSACYCKHKASGITGYSETSRSQHENKVLAFRRMYESPKFKLWIQMEYSRVTGEEKKIEEYVDKEMKKVRVEVREPKENRWVEVQTIVE